MQRWRDYPFLTTRDEYPGHANLRCPKHGHEAVHPPTVDERREHSKPGGRLCRKVARKKVAGELVRGMKIDAAAVMEMLGPPDYSAIRRETEARIGVAIGMAWTQSGGS